MYDYDVCLVTYYLSKLWKLVAENAMFNDVLSWHDSSSFEVQCLLYYTWKYLHKVSKNWVSWFTSVDWNLLELRSYNTAACYTDSGSKCA